MPALKYADRPRRGIQGRVRARRCVIRDPVREEGVQSRNGGSVPGGPELADARLLFSARESHPGWRSRDISTAVEQSPQFSLLVGRLG